MTLPPLSPVWPLPRSICLLLVAALAASGQTDPAAAQQSPRVAAAVARRLDALPDQSDAGRGLNLAAFELTPLYEADFSQPLQFAREAELFDGDRRVRRPEGVDWVLEGKGSAAAEDGRLCLRNEGDMLVFWSTRVFPPNFLLEFTISPHDSAQGLAIVFFAARGRDGGGIFELDQPRRSADFRNYHSGALDCYHASYWATSPDRAARETAHLRKNHGFYLVSKGQDFIAVQGAGPHRVRLLKVGGSIEIEVNGRIALSWIDDGVTFGPVLGAGAIGLRQMTHATECAYGGFKVWTVRNR